MLVGHSLRLSEHSARCSEPAQQKMACRLASSVECCIVVKKGNKKACVPFVLVVCCKNTSVPTLETSLCPLAFLLKWCGWPVAWTLSLGLKREAHTFFSSNHAFNLQKHMPI